MAGAAAGITLAEIAARENVSEDEAAELMDELVSEKVLKKEQRDGKTVYLLAAAAGASSRSHPGGAVQQDGSGPPVTSFKFCRECGAKISLASKFCEKCGARLET